MGSINDVFDDLVRKASGSSNKRIVLPEGEDDRVIEAVKIAVMNNLGKLVLLGNKDVITKKLTKDIANKVLIINPCDEKLKLENYAKELYELRKNKGMTLELAQKEVLKPMIFATMMVHCGDADGIVAGVLFHTADVVRPALQIIKAQEGINKISSAMIMQMPKNSLVGENGVLVLADCGIIPEPTSEDLADIAIATANTAKKLCGINPKVAMLSYSTNIGENTGVESIDKVKRAVNIAKLKCPDLIIEGEIQADAAIVPQVAELKFPNSILKGKANVLVFPDLNSANISYKLVQRIANIKAIGPLLQGLKKPVNDLSRGATAEEMVMVIAITILQS